MDTRSKIVSPEQARARLAAGSGTQSAVMAGRFDPVTAEVARLVETSADRHLEGGLMVVVLDGDGVMPASARAIVIAAMRNVDVVTVIPERDWPNWLPVGHLGPVLFNLDADRSRSSSFVDLILSKVSVAP